MQDPGQDGPKKDGQTGSAGRSQGSAGRPRPGAAGAQNGVRQNRRGKRPRQAGKRRRNPGGRSPQLRARQGAYPPKGGVTQKAAPSQTGERRRRARRKPPPFSPARRRKRGRAITTAKNKMARPAASRSAAAPPTRYEYEPGGAGGNEGMKMTEFPQPNPGGCGGRSPPTWRGRGPTPAQQRASNHSGQIKDRKRDKPQRPLWIAAR